MTITKPFSIALLLALILTACGGGTNVVDSGTYSGTIAEINADEVEIYVDLESGQQIELYFTETTTLVRDGSQVPFSEIEVGDQVQVEVERVGQRLDPVHVELMN